MTIQGTSKGYIYVDNVYVYFNAWKGIINLPKNTLVDRTVTNSQGKIMYMRGTKRPLPSTIITKHYYNSSVDVKSDILNANAMCSLAGDLLLKEGSLSGVVDGQENFRVIVRDVRLVRQESVAASTIEGSPTIYIELKWVLDCFDASVTQ